MDKAEKDAILAAQQFELAEIRRHERRAAIFFAVGIVTLISAILAYWAIYIPLDRPLWMQILTYVLYAVSFISLGKWRGERADARELIAWQLRDRYQMLKEKLEREVGE